VVEPTDTQEPVEIKDAEPITVKEQTFNEAAIEPVELETPKLVEVSDKSKEKEKDTIQENETQEDHE